MSTQELSCDWTRVANLGVPVSNILLLHITCGAGCGDCVGVQDSFMV